MTALATGLRNYLTFTTVNGADIAVDRAAIVAIEDMHSGTTKLYCEGGHVLMVNGDIGVIREQLGS